MSSSSSSSSSSSYSPSSPSSSSSSSSPLPPPVTDAASLLRYYERAAAQQQADATARNYLDLAQLAFRQCVHSFAHAEVTSKEAKCIQAVAKKHMAASLRASARFGEAQALRAREEREAREFALRERGAEGEEIFSGGAGSSGAAPR